MKNAKYTDKTVGPTNKKNDISHDFYRPLERLVSL